MAMTTERENLLVTHLAADEARTKALFEMSAEEAVAKINADGYDFTAEDIQELGTKLVTIAESNRGELSEHALENVSGGIGVATAALTITALALAIAKWNRTPCVWGAGYLIGKQVVKKVKSR